MNDGSSGVLITKVPRYGSLASFLGKVSTDSLKTAKRKSFLGRQDSFKKKVFSAYLLFQKG